MRAQGRLKRSAGAGENRKHVGVLAVAAISLLVTTPAEPGETEVHARLICGLAVNALALHVRLARENGTTQEDLKGSIEYMVPGGAPVSVLQQARRMTGAIIDALYAVPIETIELETTREQSYSVCLSCWPVFEGERDERRVRRQAVPRRTAGWLDVRISRLTAPYLATGTVSRCVSTASTTLSSSGRCAFSALQCWRLLTAAE